MSRKETPAETMKRIRKATGMSQAAFSARYQIPKRTLENWEGGVNAPPAYVLAMLAEIVEKR